MGVSLFAVVGGRFPFTAKVESALYKKICGGAFRMPRALSSSCADLIHKLLTVSTRDRFTVEQALEHPWLRGANILRQPPGFVIAADPAEDLHADALAKAAEHGFARERVKQAVLRQTRDQFTTMYYLTYQDFRGKPETAVDVAAPEPAPAQSHHDRANDRIAAGTKALQDALMASSSNSNAHGGGAKPAVKTKYKGYFGVLNRNANVNIIGDDDGGGASTPVSAAAKANVKVTVGRNQNFNPNDLYAALRG